MGVHVIMEEAVVSRGPVPVRLQLVQCHSGPRGEKGQKLLTSVELKSRKSLAVGVIPGDGTKVRKGSTYKQGGVGEERGSKETDGCPLTLEGYLRTFTSQ
jgi:hypothetical protein